MAETPYGRLSGRTTRRTESPYRIGSQSLDSGQDSFARAKDILTARRQASEDAYKREKDAPDIAEKEMKNTEMDLVYRAVYGQSAPDLQAGLKSSTTGYSDPGVAKFSKNPMTYEMIKESIKNKNKPPSEANARAAEAARKATEDAIAYAGTFSPEMKDQAGNPLTWEDVWRNISSLSRFKGFDSNDPRFAEIKASFAAKAPPPGKDWREIAKDWASIPGKALKNLMPGGDGEPKAPAAAPPPAPSGESATRRWNPQKKEWWVFDGGEWRKE